jgi:cell division protein FtsW (lipid II flippase)
MFVVFMAFVINANAPNESVWPIVLCFILATGYLISLVLIVKAANDFSNYVNCSLSSTLESALKKQRYFWILFAIVLVGLFFVLVVNSMQSINYPIENLKEPTLEPPN